MSSVGRFACPRSRLFVSRLTMSALRSVGLGLAFDEVGHVEKILPESQCSSEAFARFSSARYCSLCSSEIAAARHIAHTSAKAQLQTTTPIATHPYQGTLLSLAAT